LQPSSDEFAGAARFGVGQVVYWMPAGEYFDKQGSCTYNTTTKLGNPRRLMKVRQHLGDHTYVLEPEGTIHGDGESKYHLARERTT
jgi:hypothetical protein